MSKPFPQMTQPGFVCAKARAASRISCAGTRVIGSAHSGGNDFTCCSSSVKP